MVLLMSLLNLPKKVLTYLFTLIDTATVFALAAVNKTMRNHVKEAIEVLPHCCVSVNEEQTLFKQLVESYFYFLF
jgi:hypothetical protein